jgi:septal ring factor EnvC (AmiA/AmiB activator)
MRHLIAWLPLLAVAGTGLMAWGATSQRVADLENKAKRAVDDHDRIVRIETQIESVTTTISEIRTEQKEVADDVQRLEQTIQDSFRELLQELRTNS